MCRRDRVERYFSLMPEGNTTLQDIALSPGEMRIGDNRLCLHTLSDAEDLPGKVATDTRYEKLSTDRSDCLSLIHISCSPPGGSANGYRQ